MIVVACGLVFTAPTYERPDNRATEISRLVSPRVRAAT
jgi:hypothetical protein